jgi:hypothetical protein
MRAPCRLRVRAELEKFNISEIHRESLKYEYIDVIKPHPFFPTIVECLLVERANRTIGALCFYMPHNSSAMPAKKLIVKVNPRMPRVFGDSSVQISEAAAIVENQSRLFSVSDRPLTLLDERISKYIVEMVPDRAPLQVGIGGVSNAVCAALQGPIREPILSTS